MSVADNRVVRLFGRCLLIGMAVIFVHELGHYLTALVLGLRPWIVFRTAVYRFGTREIKIRTPVTRYKEGADWKMRLVASMGFGGCLVFAVALCGAVAFGLCSVWWLFGFLGAVAVHFVTYSFRMKDSESNDFNGMCAH